MIKNLEPKIVFQLRGKHEIHIKGRRIGRKLWKAHELRITCDFMEVTGDEKILASLNTDGGPIYLNKSKLPALIIDDEGKKLILR